MIVWIEIESVNCPIMSSSFQPHGLQPTSLCPWNSPGKNTRVGGHSLLQRIFPTQGLNLSLPHCRWILYQLSHKRRLHMGITRRSTQISDDNSWFIWKYPDDERDWGQEEKRMTEDDMAGWHHWLNGHGFGWTPGVGDRQGGLGCCGSWVHK